MMNEAENRVVVEGILSEMNLRTGVTNDGREYISGDVKIRVEQEICGDTVLSVVPLHAFAMKFKKDGSGINPSYDSLYNAMNTFKSLAITDETEATRVQTTSGKITENIYVKDGTVYSTPRLRFSFIKAIPANECEQKAEFDNTIVIANIKDEVKNDEPTGNLAVKAIIPQYGGKADVVDFIVKADNAKAHINSYWKEGDTVAVHGKINISTITEKTYETMGFGEPVERVHTKNARELVIISGSPSGFDADRAYNVDEVRTAMKERSVRIEEEKAKPAKSASASTPATNTAANGFGGLGDF